MYLPNFSEKNSKISRAFLDYNKKDNSISSVKLCTQIVTVGLIFSLSLWLFSLFFDSSGQEAFNTANASTTINAIAESAVPPKNNSKTDVAIPLEVQTHLSKLPVFSPDEFEKFKVVMRNGDNLETSLQRINISNKVRRQIINSFKDCLDFKRLRPNDTYTIYLDAEGVLQRCDYEAGPLEIYTIVRQDNKLVAERVPIPLESQLTSVGGTINYSLFSSFRQQGEEGALMYAFADIFASRIDFNTETKKGDSFKLLVEKYFKDGKFVRYGEILSAQYQRADGKILEGFLFEGEINRTAYFDRKGNELGASFIRSPVPVGRVSSKFSYRRKHPITGKVQPHLGIDLAAPVGTPIMASADGTVVFVGRKGGFGKQIIISHGGGYRTHYGHLSRFRKGLKKGKQVSQKDIIGYVGSTGMSTGPHLDYRLQHKGIFKNPFAIDFKPKSVLKGQKLAELEDQIYLYADLLDPSNDKKILQVRHLTYTHESKVSFL